MIDAARATPERGAEVKVILDRIKLMQCSPAGNITVSPMPNNGASPLILLRCVRRQPPNCRSYWLRQNVHGRSDHTLLAHELLGDDPAVIIDALKAAIRAGAAPADLARSLAYGAALRVARFGNANEHADWETAHHVFTYTNALHQISSGSALPAPMAMSRPCAACCTERWRSTLLAI